MDEFLNRFDSYLYLFLRITTQCYQITLYAVLLCVSFIVKTGAKLEEKMAAFINAEQAKIMS
ncbi:MAG: hypothetical protein RSC03_11130, partial [Acinetobacter sp.]